MSKDGHKACKREEEEVDINTVRNRVVGENANGLEFPQQSGRVLVLGLVELLAM